jgi:hypothetical protein
MARHKHAYFCDEKDLIRRLRGYKILFMGYKPDTSVL